MILRNFFVPAALLTSSVLLLNGCSLFVSAKPVILIATPFNGSKFDEGEEVSVQSTSTDPKGIMRVALVVDGITIRTDIAHSPQANFTLIQTWQATKGSHTLSVIAYDTAGAPSDPASVIIFVAASTAPIEPVAPSEIVPQEPLGSPPGLRPLQPDAPPPSASTSPTSTLLPPSRTPTRLIIFPGQQIQTRILVPILPTNTPTPKYIFPGQQIQTRILVPILPTNTPTRFITRPTLVIPPVR